MAAPTILFLFRLAERIEKRCSQLEAEIRKAKESLNQNDEIHEHYLEWSKSLSDKIRGIFSLFGVYSILFGPTLTASIFLHETYPSIKSLYSQFYSFLAENRPKLQHIANIHLSDAQLEEVKEDLEFAFGENSRIGDRLSRLMSERIN
ncbi:MAG: hypothetical protein QXE12_06195 [Conexivisphaerales archaeon]